MYLCFRFFSRASRSLALKRRGIDRSKEPTGTAGTETLHAATATNTVALNIAESLADPDGFSRKTI